MSRSEPSYDDLLVLVDQLDNPVGTLSKTDCHKGSGLLHRAFSVLLFNDAGELLLQQRSAHKPLWPGYWSNTCCSHPRAGEAPNHAVKRRLWEELGIECTPRFLYKFRYQAQYDDHGAEHEYCWVYVGQYSGAVTPNVDEVMDWRYISPRALRRELEQAPSHFTPWFHMEWETLVTDYPELIPSDDITLYDTAT